MFYPKPILKVKTEAFYRLIIVNIDIKNSFGYITFDN